MLPLPEKNPPHSRPISQRYLNLHSVARIGSSQTNPIGQLSPEEQRKLKDVNAMVKAEHLSKDDDLGVVAEEVGRGGGPFVLKKMQQSAFRLE